MKDPARCNKRGLLFPSFLVDQTTQTCAQCGTGASPGMRFCGGCGSPLNLLCEGCGTQNPGGFKFCGQCGSPLGRGETEVAERRQLTVMFCDLVGSTVLSERLDPEELREVVREYQQVSGEIIVRFGGYVAQYLGDGLLVYFGYPAAHEDDPRRAVLAGMQICGAVAALGERLKGKIGSRLAVRVGIHTGLVVTGTVGAEGRHERLALGPTPNIAARLEGQAEPGTVVLSGTTHRLVRRFVDCRPLGKKLLKGTSSPAELYQPLHERDARSRLQWAGRFRGSRTPLEGRRRELETIRKLRQEVHSESVGRAVLLVGEAGIGKSRLAYHLATEGRREEPEENRPETVRVIHGSTYAEASAFHPLIEMVEGMCGLNGSEPPSEKLVGLRRLAEDHRQPVVEAVPLLAGLLSVPLTEEYAALGWSGVRQKEKTLELLLELLLDAVDEQPPVLVFEDLHWFDPSSLTLIDRLLLGLEERPAFVLLTARPSFTSPWGGKRVRTIPLGRLDDATVRRMAARIAEALPLPEAILERLVAKADGVPLYVEELTRVVVEHEAEGYVEGGKAANRKVRPEIPIPTTLQDSLLARLDRLSSVKQVVQLAAVVGREVSYPLLRAICPLPEAQLRDDLAQLVEAEILLESGAPPQAIYVFRHALIQEAAYDTVLRSIRARHHRLLAAALVERFPETVEVRPELVAHHFKAAGAGEQAIDFWLQAGERAAGRSAHLEAIEHLRQGLEQLTVLPPEARWRRLEMRFQGALGPSLMATRGYHAPEVAEVYRRGLELAELEEDVEEQTRLLWGLATFHQGRGELQQSLELGRRLMEHTGGQEGGALPEAHMIVGSTLFLLGRFQGKDGALEHFDAARAAALRAADTSALGQDTEATALLYTALVLFLLGEPERSMEHCREALALAEARQHPFTLTGCHVFAGWIHHMRGESEPTLTHAERALALSAEFGFPFWEAWAGVNCGWALARQGRGAEGVEQIRAGLTLFGASGMRFLSTYFLAMLAEAQYCNGDSSGALKTLEEALTAAGETGERFWEAEIHCLRGKFGGREKPFHRALEVARGQRAKALEARALDNLEAMQRSPN